MLRDEAGMPTDTVAKLLYEWRSGQPGDEHLPVAPWAVAAPERTCSCA
ncbi:MAG: hypothetical protein M5T61_18840 [Acidimicrobiia bacterium]|nr:hypothetical protein [Acidimicrobiia bacterium]